MVLSMSLCCRNVKHTYEYKKVCQSLYLECDYGENRSRHLDNVYFGTAVENTDRMPIVRVKCAYASKKTNETQNTISIYLKKKLSTRYK